MNLDEAMVQQVVNGLVSKHQITEHGGFGGRVTKYQHRFEHHYSRFVP